MRNRYVRNPACFCAWCANGGTNPTPGNPAALGYDEPHMGASILLEAPDEIEAESSSVATGSPFGI
jgi:hypothetical protein